MNRNETKRAVRTLAAAACFLPLTLAWGQVEVDTSVPFPERGTVVVGVAFGSVEVVGDAEKEVRIRGTIPAVAEGLDVDTGDDGASVSISVDLPDEWIRTKGDHADLRSNLTIHVPRTAHVGVETMNASVSIRDVTGEVSVESMNGPIEVRGGEKVEIESMTGTVLVDAAASLVEVESIAGRVDVRGVREVVRATSVAGEIAISGGPFREVDVESTSGAVTLDGAIAPDGTVGIETFSGDVRLSLPADVKARFEIATWSGSIENELGPTQAADDDLDPHHELHFATGLAGAEIAIETFSGNVTLEKRRH
jgi:DUF4097 and DUF4098 domain-containing protein YvlB